MAPLPCDSTYPSLGLAKDSLNFWVRERGYGVSIARSKARKGGSKDTCKAYLICDRGGQYRDNNKSLLNRRVRRSGSRKMSCPFRATVIEWEGVWMVEVQHAEHNHKASYYTSAHPVHRRFDIYTSGAQDMSLSHMKVGLGVKDSLRILRRTNPGTAITAKDIHNLRSKFKRRELQGLSPLQALLFGLGDTEDYITFNRRDENDRLKDLFFAHKQSLELLRKHAEVLVMDSTYKTNRFRLPLFNICRSTFSNTTFSVASAFLSSEDTESFKWVLARLQGVYQTLELPPPTTFVTDADSKLIAAIRSLHPNSNHLLCIWHVCKNLSVHGKRVLVPKP